VDFYDEDAIRKFPEINTPNNYHDGLFSTSKKKLDIS